MILDKPISFSRGHHIILWLILHVLEFVANVHLDQFLTAVQCEGGIPVFELELLRRDIVPDKFIETVAAVVYGSQELIRKRVD